MVYISSIFSFLIILFILKYFAPQLKLIDNPNFTTITFKSIINTPVSLPTSPPKSKLIDVRKKSFTTLSGNTKEKIFPNTPPKIAPTKRDITIICTLRFCKSNFQLNYVLFFNWILLGLILKIQSNTLEII